MDLTEFTPFLKLLAHESSSIIKKYFRTDFNIENKEDLSPVTIADKLTEEKMRELILKEFPSHGIIGEEFGTYNYICDVSANTRGVNYRGRWIAEISGWSEHFLTYIAALEGLQNKFEEQ